MKVYSSSEVSPQVSRSGSEVQNQREVTDHGFLTYPLSWKTAKSIGGNDMQISSLVGYACQAGPPLQGCDEELPRWLIVQSIKSHR